MRQSLGGGEPEDEGSAQTASSTNGHGRSNGNGNGKPVRYEVTPQLLAEAKAAISAQLRRDSLSDPDAVDPLEIGPQRAQDPRLWGDALRDFLLPEDEQQHVDNSADDPEFREALKSAFDRDFPHSELS